MKIPNCGEIHLLDKMLKSEDRLLHLYKNDYTPTDADLENCSQYTECAFTGYAAKTLTGANWATPTTNASGKAESTYAEQSWTVTAANSESYYGYYVTTTDSKLLWAERFSDAPCTLTDGNIEKVTVTYTGTSEA
jgi:hypothetical protein